METLSKWADSRTKTQVKMNVLGIRGEREYSKLNSLCVGLEHNGLTDAEAGISMNAERIFSSCQR